MYNVCTCTPTEYNDFLVLRILHHLTYVNVYNVFYTCKYENTIVLMGIHVHTVKTNILRFPKND